MSGTIKTGTHKINGVSTDYYYPDPVGDIEIHSEQKVDGVQKDYYSGPAVGSIEECTHEINGVPKVYYKAVTTGFGSEGGGRYFTTLSTAGSKYYTIPTKALAGDFDISITFASSTLSTMVLINEGGGGGDFIQIPSSNNGISIRFGGVSRNYVVTTPLDGKLHTVRIVNVATSCELFFDGVSAGSQAIGAAPYNLLNIGRLDSGSQYFDGVISDVKITDAGVLDRYYKIDETWDDNLVLVNSAATLGAEIITSTPGDWSTSNANITFPSGRVRVTNTAASQGSATFALNQNIGDTLLAGLFNKTDSGSSGEGWIVNPFKSLSPEDELLVFPDISNTGDLTIRCNGTGIGDWVEFDLPTVKSAQGYGTAVNITSADSEEFTQVGDDWKAIENLWVLGDYTSTGSEGAYAQTLGDTALEIGKAYRTSLIASGFTSGEMRYRQNADELTVSADGSYESDTFVAVTTASRIRVGATQSNAGAKFSNIAVNKFLEAP